jgi:hypothetical protein
VTQHKLTGIKHVNNVSDGLDIERAPVSVDQCTLKFIYSQTSRVVSINGLEPAPKLRVGTGWWALRWRGRTTYQDQREL